MKTNNIVKIEKADSIKNKVRFFCYLKYMLFVLYCSDSQEIVLHASMEGFSLKLD